MTTNKPPVRDVLQTASEALIDLHDYVIANHEHLDLLRVQLLASNVQTKLEMAKLELSLATCDMEASLNRL